MIQDLNERFVARWVGGTVSFYQKKRSGTLEPPTKPLAPNRVQQKSLHQAAHDLFMVVMYAYVNSRVRMSDATRDVLTDLKDACETGTWKEVWTALENALESLKNDAAAENEAVKQALLEVQISQLMYPLPHLRQLTP